MNYPVLTQIIENTFQGTHAIKINITVSPSLFQALNKSISDIHRQITNSKQMVAGTTNRDFWKSVFVGGLYTYNISKADVSLTYYVIPRSQITTQHIQQIRLRIKKVVWSYIQIEETPPPQENELFNLQQTGIRFIGKGHYHKNNINLNPQEHQVAANANIGAYLSANGITQGI